MGPVPGMLNYITLSITLQVLIQQRRALLGQYLSDTPNIQNIVQLLNRNNYDEISQLSKYINIICKAFN